MFPYPIQHGHLREMLLQTARELGAETRTNAEVVEVAEDCRSVRLASGEVIKADVIIGADGSRGMCRALVAPQDPPNATGVMLFKYVLQPPFFPCYVFTGIISAVIPADRIRADPELRSLVEQEQVTINHYFVTADLMVGSPKVSQWAWFGHERASVCFPIVCHHASQ